MVHGVASHTEPGLWCVAWLADWLAGSTAGQGVPLQRQARDAYLSSVFPTWNPEPGTKPGTRNQEPGARPAHTRHMEWGGCRIPLLHSATQYRIVPCSTSSAPLRSANILVSRARAINALPLMCVRGGVGHTRAGVTALRRAGSLRRWASA